MSFIEMLTTSRIIISIGKYVREILQNRHTYIITGEGYSRRMFVIVRNGQEQQHRDDDMCRH